MTVHALAWIGLVLLASAASLLLARSTKARIEERGLDRPRIESLHGDDAAMAGWPEPPPVGWPGVDARDDAFAFAFHASWARAFTEGRSAHTMTVLRFGWPFPVMREVSLWSTKHDPTRLTHDLEHSRTLWLGLALDSLLLGSAAWCVMVGAPWLAFGVRARRRRNAGRCVHCNHRLAHATTCPECGRVV